MLTPKLIPIEKMEQEDVQIEKWQPKTKVATSRNKKSREGYMNIGHHAGRQNLAHGVVEQMEKSEEQVRLNNTAVQLEKMFGLEGMSRPKTSLDEALDLYDDVLQKADMDWDNVSEEELVQLEKIFGRWRKEKSPEQKREGAVKRAGEVGLEVPGGPRGRKDKESIGFSREDQRRVREAKVKAEADAANVERAKTESPARRRAAQRENIKRAPGRAGRAVGEAAADKGTGAALRVAGGVDRASRGLSRFSRAVGRRGKEAAQATKREVSAGARATGRGLRAAGEAVEPAGLQRRRERGGGGPKGRQQAEYKRGQSSPTGSEGPPGRSSGSRVAGLLRRGARLAGQAGEATKTAAKDFGRGFAEGAGESLQPFKKPENPTTGGAQVKEKVVDRTPKKGWGGGAPPGSTYNREKMAMSKAMISLQKFLDNDCGCDSPK